MKDLPDYDPNASCPTGSSVVQLSLWKPSEATRAIVPETLSQLARQEQLTRTQMSRVRDGLRWAQRFGLLDHRPWEHYKFDTSDVRTALILSLIVEAARKGR